MRMENIMALIAPDALLQAVGLVVMVLPGLLAMGAGCVAVLTAAAYRKTSRVFADKLAKQMAEFSMLALGAWLLLISARWGFWVAEIWPASNAVQGFYQLFFDVPGRMALVAILLSIIVVRAWRRTKRSAAMHFVLGGTASLVWMVALMLFIVAGLENVRSGSTSAKMDFQSVAVRLLEPTTWMIWAQVFFWGMALAGGAGLLYLVLRRNREDYGRDYYGWAARACARRALSSGVVQACWAGAILLALTFPWAELAMLEPTRWMRTALPTLSASPVFPPMAAFLVLSLVAWLSLIPLVKNQNPMRMKGLMLAHVLLMLAAAVMLAQVVARLHSA